MSQRFSSTRPEREGDLIVIDLRGEPIDVATRTVVVEPITRDGQGHKMARLRATSIQEMHDFIEICGLDAAGCVIGSVTTLTHYSLTPRQRRQAIRAGAHALDWAETYEWIAHAVIVGTRPPPRQSITMPGARRSSKGELLAERPSGVGRHQGVSASSTTVIKSPFRRSQLARANRFAPPASESVTC